VAAAPVFREIGEQLLTRFRTNIRDNPVQEDENMGGRVKVNLVSASAPLVMEKTTEADDSLVPDFRGMTIREVLKKSKEKGLDTQVIGSGWATTQRPAAGLPVPKDRLCTVTFSMGS
jgi:cell division protein FtsI (penicillin-binding protein 3)